jgi:hypothetical protein
MQSCVNLLEIGKRKVHTHIKEEEDCDHKGRVWRDVTKSQGMLKSLGARRGKKQILP